MNEMSHGATVTRRRTCPKMFSARPPAWLSVFSVGAKSSSTALSWLSLQTTASRARRSISSLADPVSTSARIVWRPMHKRTVGAVSGDTQSLTFARVPVVVGDGTGGS